jgi:hypothetical protein
VPVGWVNKKNAILLDDAHDVQRAFTRSYGDLRVRYGCGRRADKRALRLGGRDMYALLRAAGAGVRVR